ncbi:hypothetical protein NQ318_016589 [Aromia moschata]|uniref:Uncharacterized protein n=1 Tax=Aromia moschata TaxID=1265417 RepID=A0AAV8YYL4_9CUCU|nr:hypothetical protein NQ318_016589 [Aromia moschata]
MSDLTTKFPTSHLKQSITSSKTQQHLLSQNQYAYGAPYFRITPYNEAVYKPAIYATPPEPAFLIFRPGDLYRFSFVFGRCGRKGEIKAFRFELPLLLCGRPLIPWCFVRPRQPQRRKFVVVRLFQEKYPDLPPIYQGTVSKIEKQFRECGDVRQLKKNPPSKLSDDQ